MSAEEAENAEEKAKEKLVWDQMEDFEEKWEQVNDGIMSDHLFRQHETHDDHPVPPGSMKEKLLTIMSHWRFEVSIVVLIIIDLVVTLVEMGLEYKFLCVTPELVPLGRDQIRGLTFHHDLFLSEDVLDNTSSRLHASPWTTLQGEASKGAMMLQVSTHGSSTWTVVDAIDRQPEEEKAAVVDAIDDEGAEHEADGNIEAQGHKHRHEKTLLCEGPHGKRLHKIHFYCHVGGLMILSMFILELVLKAWINPAQFIRSKLQVLDLIIVTTSFSLDFIWPIFESRHPELLETRSDIVRVIILFIRLIRVVKVMHATTEVLRKGLTYVRELKHEVQERDEQIEKLRKEIADMKGGKSQ